jgi:hypothetical protein
MKNEVMLKTNLIQLILKKFSLPIKFILYN